MYKYWLTNNFSELLCSPLRRILWRFLQVILTCSTAQRRRSTRNAAVVNQHKWLGRVKIVNLALELYVYCRHHSKEFRVWVVCSICNALKCSHNKILSMSPTPFPTQLQLKCTRPPIWCRWRGERIWNNLIIDPRSVIFIAEMSYKYFDLWQRGIWGKF